VLEVRPLRPADVRPAAGVLAGLAGAGAPGTVALSTGEDLITVAVPGEAMVTAAAHCLDAARIPVRHLAVRLPSLDEAFLAITGHHALCEADASELDGARQ
jgi:oleandomycin transport system ATP-binding protein